MDGNSGVELLQAAKNYVNHRPGGDAQRTPRNIHAFRGAARLKTTPPALKLALEVVGPGPRLQWKINGIFPQQRFAGGSNLLSRMAVRGGFAENPAISRRTHARMPARVPGARSHARMPARVPGFPVGFPPGFPWVPWGARSHACMPARVPGFPVGFLPGFPWVAWNPLLSQDQ